MKKEPCPLCNKLASVRTNGRFNRHGKCEGWGVLAPSVIAEREARGQRAVGAIVGIIKAYTGLADSDGLTKAAEKIARGQWLGQ